MTHVTHTTACSKWWCINCTQDAREYCGRPDKERLTRDCLEFESAPCTCGREDTGSVELKGARQRIIEQADRAFTSAWDQPAEGIQKPPVEKALIAAASEGLRVLHERIMAKIDADEMAPDDGGLVVSLLKEIRDCVAAVRGDSSCPVGDCSSFVDALILAVQQASQRQETTEPRALEARQRLNRAVAAYAAEHSSQTPNDTGKEYSAALDAYGAALVAESEQASHAEIERLKAYIVAQQQEIEAFMVRLDALLVRAEAAEASQGSAQQEIETLKDRVLVEKGLLVVSQLLAEKLVKRAEQAEQGIARISRKLEAGTLHVGYCNGNHDERVGKAGMVCNCTLGREIKELRHRLEQADAPLSQQGSDHVDLLARAHARLVVCRDLTDDAQLDCAVIRDLMATLRSCQQG